MKKLRKHRCSKCNKIAVWLYMPSSNGRHFFCDDCVPRGCTCNVDNISEFGEPSSKQKVIWWTKIGEEYTFNRPKNAFYYEILDEKNRRFPCCEYEYDREGYDLEDNIYYLNVNDILHTLNSLHICFYLHLNRDNNPFVLYFTQFLIDNSKDNIIEYNIFMNELRTKLNEWKKLDSPTMYGNFSEGRADLCFYYFKECLIHKKFLKND